MSPLAKVLQAQHHLLKYHLSPTLFSKIEIPARHGGLNSIKVVNNNNHQQQPPIIVLHGFGSGLGFFFALLPELFQQGGGRTIYLVDWLGCGGSDRIKYSSWCNNNNKSSRVIQNAEYFTLPLSEWMNAEKIDKGVILGHSLGGLLSSRFAEQFPDRVSSLFLLSPVGFGSSDIKRQKERSNSIPFKLLDFLWSANVTPQQLVRLFHATGQVRGRAFVHNLVQRRFGNHVTWNVNLLSNYLYEISTAVPSGEYALNALLLSPFQQGAVVARQPILESLASKGFPVHTVFGDHDWLGTPTAIANARKVGKLSILSSAGHHLYLDQPQALARICVS